MAVFASRMLAVIPRLSGFLFPRLMTDDNDAPLMVTGESAKDDPNDLNGRRCASVDVAAAVGAPCVLRP
jgi:hypothetical protein